MTILLQSFHPFKSPCNRLTFTHVSKLIIFDTVRHEATYMETTDERVRQRNRLCNYSNRCEKCDVESPVLPHMDWPGCECLLYIYPQSWDSSGLVWSHGVFALLEWHLSLLSARYWRTVMSPESVRAETRPRTHKHAQCPTWEGAPALSELQIHPGFYSLPHIEKHPSGSWAILSLHQVRFN